MIIQDKLEVSLELDGVDYALYLGTSLEKIRIIENVNEHAPSLEISFSDIAGAEGIPSVYDGMPVLLTVTALASDQNTTLSMPFRVYNHIEIPKEQGTILRISAYFDLKDFLISSAFGYVEGTSYEVARQMAEQNELEFEGDQSADSQIWLRTGISGADFLHHTCRHGYKNNKSVYASCVTRQGQLRYYDLPARAKDTSLWSFLEVTELSAGTTDSNTVIPIVDYEKASLSGFLNKQYGYSVHASQYSAINGKNDEVFIQELEKTTDYLSINTDLFDPTKYISGPMNCGNTHGNYFRAMVQNLMGLSLYSNGLTIFSSFPKNVSLLDRASVVVKDDQETSAQQPKSGDYFVSSIVSVITGSGYTSAYSLLREGFSTSEQKTKVFG